MSDYVLDLTKTVRRQLAEHLPEKVAAAVWEFMAGPLLTNPHRVGKRLRAPQAHLFVARRGTYRIFYEIDDESRIVLVVKIEHRRDAYRTDRH